MLHRLGFDPARAKLNAAVIVSMAAAIGCLLGRKAPTGKWGMMEALRYGLLFCIALAIALPFLTTSFVGGLDARWYAYVLADHLEQARAGVFPVLVGQGSYQFNGAVHPFRFAPLYQNLAMVVDWATARQLSFVALQHSTVVVAVCVAAFGCYYGLVQWHPTRRWTAWLVSVVYLLSPAAFALLCIHDMYMSFLASAWIPLAFHFAQRMSSHRDYMSAALLAAVLTVIFNAHPPVALWTTLVAAVFSSLALWAERPNSDVFKLPLACLASLGLLNAFQFWGISELSPVGQSSWSATHAAVAIVAVAVGIAAGAGYLLRRKRTQALTSPDRANALLIGLAATIFAAVAMHLLIQPTATTMAEDTVAFARLFKASLWTPVTAAGSGLTDSQPGLALVAGGVLAIGCLWWLRDTRAKLFSAAACVLLLCLVPMTPFSRVFWTTAPGALIAATSGVVNLRINPVLVALLAFALFGTLVELADRQRRAFHVSFVVLALLAAWSARELTKILRFSRSLTHSDAQTQRIMRPENAPLFIYSGNFIGLPEYFSHGVRDFRFESRVLNPSTGTAEQTPPHNFDATTAVTLRAGDQPVEAGWVSLEPALPVGPRESLRLLFDFPQSAPAGVLVLESPHLYREYTLPASGGSLAFGAGDTASRELPLWSTANEPQEVQMRFRPNDPAKLLNFGEPFAALRVLEFDQRDLPVRTIQLSPMYRAVVDRSTPAALETPRTWVPGYVATRNGLPVTPFPSRNNLVTVPLETGHNAVELRFVGTSGLHVAWMTSIAAWTALAAAVFNRFRGRQSF